MFWVGVKNNKMLITRHRIEDGEQINRLIILPCAAGSMNYLPIVSDDCTAMRLENCMKPGELMEERKGYYVNFEKD